MQCDADGAAQGLRSDFNRNPGVLGTFLITHTVHHHVSATCTSIYRARSTYRLARHPCLAGYSLLILAWTLHARTYVLRVESVKQLAHACMHACATKADRSLSRPLSSHFCLHGGNRAFAAFVHDFVQCDMLQRF